MKKKERWCILLLQMYFKLFHFGGTHKCSITKRSVKIKEPRSSECVEIFVDLYLYITCIFKMASISRLYMSELQEILGEF